MEVQLLDKVDLRGGASVLQGEENELAHAKPEMCFVDLETLFPTGEKDHYSLLSPPAFPRPLLPKELKGNLLFHGILHQVGPISPHHSSSLYHTTEPVAPGSSLLFFSYASLRLSTGFLEGKLIIYKYF